MEQTEVTPKWEKENEPLAKGSSEPARLLSFYSHSIVPGGFEVTS